MGIFTKYLRRSKPIWLLMGLIFFYSNALESFPQLGMETQIKQEEVKLAKLKNKIARWEKEIAKNKEMEQSILTRMERIERRLEIMEKELQIYDWNLEAAEKKERELEDLARQSGSQLHRKKSLLKKEIREIYKINQYHNPIISQANNSFLLRKYLRTLIISDLLSIAQEEKIQKVALQNQIALEKRQERIKLYRERVLRQKEAIEQEKSIKGHLLAAIRDKEYLYEKTQEELEEASNKLSNLIKGLQSQDKEGPFSKGFIAKKGKLSWPIKGEINTSFGRVKHPRFNYYLFNKGIDIRAQLGSFVRAIDAGKVLFADWLRGYGKLLIIDHGEGYYSLYGHLSQTYAKVGDFIDKGQTIAALGDNISLIGPSLYFEIRHHGKPENPVPWLVKKR